MILSVRGFMKAMERGRLNDRFNYTWSSFGTLGYYAVQYRDTLMQTQKGLLWERWLAGLVWKCYKGLSAKIWTWPGSVPA